MIWPFSLLKRRNRDLSERFEGKLEITIEGLCSETMVFDYDTLATHVACVYLAHGGDYVLSFCSYPVSQRRKEVT